LIGSYLWFLPRAFFRTGAMGVGQAPGLPCALCFSRDVASGKTRARCVAGMRRCVSASLRAKRSNPECVRGKILDCFVAEPVIGLAEGETRWLLAMTGCVAGGCVAV